MIFENNRSLKELNWWKVGGDAEHFCQPESAEELKSAVLKAKENSWPIRVLSGGSNILIQDGLISGLTIHLQKLTGLEILEDSEVLKVRCLAGTPKSELAKIFLQKKLAPAVFLTGLPGDIGGGVVMNAGIGEQRVPREFCEITKAIKVISLSDNSYAEEIEMPADKIQWSYRDSQGWQPGIIVSADFAWDNSPSDEVMKEVREANRKRVSTQPLNKPTCGSTFRNPTGEHTGLKSAKLIEECGLKGHQIGGAKVSEKHANFIENTGDATAKDIFALILHMQKTVKDQKGVDLHREVVLFGDWNNC